MLYCLTKVVWGKLQRAFRGPAVTFEHWAVGVTNNIHKTSIGSTSTVWLLCYSTPWCTIGQVFRAYLLHLSSIFAYLCILSVQKWCLLLPVAVDFRSVVKNSITAEAKTTIIWTRMLGNSETLCRVQIHILPLTYFLKFLFVFCGGITGILLWKELSAVVRRAQRIQVSRVKREEKWPQYFKLESAFVLFTFTLMTSTKIGWW